MSATNITRPLPSAPPQPDACNDELRRPLAGRSRSRVRGRYRAGNRSKLHGNPAAQQPKWTLGAAGNLSPKSANSECGNLDWWPRVAGFRVKQRSSTSHPTRHFLPPRARVHFNRRFQLADSKKRDGSVAAGRPKGAAAGEPIRSDRRHL